jgi:hypothetical protein
MTDMDARRRGEDDGARDGVDAGSGLGRGGGGGVQVVDVYGVRVASCRRRGYAT